MVAPFKPLGGSKITHIKKWYFAGQFSRLTEIVNYAAEARAAGLGVTSRWLSQNPASGYAGGSDEAGREFARRDLEDIAAVDGFLFFAEDPAAGVPRGGRHVEFGVAIATSKIMEVVGPMENVFHLLENVKHFPTFDAWLQSKVKEVR